MVRSAPGEPPGQLLQALPAACSLKSGAAGLLGPQKPKHHIYGPRAAHVPIQQCYFRASRSAPGGPPRQLLHAPNSATSSQRCRCRPAWPAACARRASAPKKPAACAGLGLGCPVCFPLATTEPPSCYAVLAASPLQSKRVWDRAEGVYQGTARTPPGPCAAPRSKQQGGQGAPGPARRPPSTG